MHDVNWWLMFLAFLLGLLLTLAMMIRRVTREVPITHTVSVSAEAAGTAAATGAAGVAAAKLHAAAERTAEKVSADVQHVEKALEKTIEKTVEKTVQKVRQVDVIEEVPYGGGSIRVTARKVGPAGYTIKGDKDTGRYFTTDSPDYADIEAEVWFANEASAEKAGFLRWDAKAGDTAHGLTGADATVIREDHSADATMVITGGGSDVSPVKIQVVSAAEIGDAPHGKGSARAAADGTGPDGWLIKGNADSGLYHGPDSPSYRQTIAEVWFVDEATAVAAGFKKWDTNLK